MSKATIDDVARLAGVSIKTVSRVVNGEPNVSANTRAKVNSAVEELNYTPNLSARKLASRRSFLIGLLYDDPSHYEIPSSGYVVSIQEGALKACKARNYDLLIHPCVYEDRSIGDEITKLIEHSRLDGIVIAPPLSNMRPIIRAIEKTSTPFARISPGDADNKHATVMTNDREICARMTQYLAQLGHERIAFITGHRDHLAIANRFLGYRDGLESCAIKFRKRLVKSGDNSIRSGEQAARRLLGEASPPTAIFAANDDMAAGVLRVALQSGIRVPEQLSVAGFDDIPLAQQIYPSLTTVKQPLDAMAELATNILIDCFSPNRKTVPPQIIESELVLRNSTAPCAARD